MSEEKLYQIALSIIPGIGDVITKNLISYCGSAKAVFQNNKSKLSKIPGVGSKTASLISSQPYLSEAEKEIKAAEKQNVQILYYTDKKYPERLKQVYDSPPLLYFKGNCNLNALKIISVVGTRMASNYGREVVEEIVSDLVQHNALIISGLAYGIDIFAHRNAIKNNLPTVGVMASGSDIIYPSVHKEIALQMMTNGGLLTEYRLGVKPDAHNFPMRNRIIAGMSDAVIVVEAAKKGGALITAEIAHSYNKDVFAVPGNINLKTSEGCNNLIRSLKANIFLSIKDVETSLGWDLVSSSGKPETNYKYEKEELTVEERKIVEILISNNKELSIDDLSWKTQINISSLASILLSLEFQGIIKPLPGKKFKLI